jgi:hypothetical protein
MRTGRRGAWAGLVGLAVLVSGPARADEPIPAPKEEKRPAVLPPDAHGLNDHAGPGEVNGHNGHEAAHHDEIETGPLSGVFFEGDYLLIKPRRQALDFAILAPNRAVLPGGSVESVDWGTTSGFRAGGGYRMHDGWAVGVFYTYFHSEDQRVLLAPPGGALLATLTQGGGVDDVGFANAVTNIDFNVIDLEARKQLCVGELFALKLFGGGRFAWIDQQFGVVYNGGTLGPNNPVYVNSPVYFRGAGLTAGGEGTWKFREAWGLYGRARLSLLSGQFTTSLGQSLAAGAVQIVDVREKYNAVIPVGELGAGVSYTGEHWSFAVGYDLANWFNMVNSIDFPDGASLGHINRRHSDLMLEGLSVRLGLVF